jgi:hypothetical protein
MFAVLRWSHGYGFSCDRDAMPLSADLATPCGTEFLNPDCTGSASLIVQAGKPPLNYHLIVVDRGRQIHFWSASLVLPWWTGSSIAWFRSSAWITGNP